MICIPLVGRSNEEMRALMARAAPLADLLELRLDGIADPDVRGLLENRPRPVIVTIRAQAEGGKWTGSEERRLRLLEEAGACGAEYVDVELAAAGNCRITGARRIISVHDLQGTPRNLAQLHEQIAAAGADVVKIAVTALDICDTLPVFALLRAARKPTIALSMGEAGQITRILGRKYGGFLSYAALDDAGGSAPGQLTAARLRYEFRYERIGPRTDVYGVIANPVAHSLSPAIHNAAFAELGLDAVYAPFLVNDVVRFIKEFRALDVKGYSVTIPHKEGVLDAVDAADDIARRVGAANTVCWRDGQLLATNTDVAGAMGALEQGLAGKKLAGRRALILGAGGAARAIAFGLRERGARMIVANRTFERGRQLAAEFGAEAIRVEDLPGVAAEVVINTTSVGMHPQVDETPLPREALRPGMAVFDAVYNPRETRLLREARAAGCQVISGENWLLHQAVLQFRLWTGLEPSFNSMRHALRGKLRQ